jgi:hypothetical protein
MARSAPWALGCSPGGDRGLLDFLSLTVGLHGEANVVWADAVIQNFVGGTSSAVIAFNRQISGPSLYTSVGHVNGGTAATGSAAGSPDAFFSANGSTTAATGNLVIKSASVSRPDNQHYKITINVQDLTRLVVPPTLGGSDAVWLVRWEVADPNRAGHTTSPRWSRMVGKRPRSSTARHRRSTPLTASS